MLGWIVASVPKIGAPEVLTPAPAPPLGGSVRLAKDSR